MADILGIGASGLSAYRKSLEVTGNNIVNAGTEGYARRTATLASSGERASSPTSIAQGGGGVTVDLIRRASDSFLQARMWNSNAASGRAQSLADGLSRLEKGLLTTPSNVNKAVGDFFAKVQDLTASPVSMPARFAVIDAAERVVTQFREQDGVVASEMGSAQANIAAGMRQLNVLTAQLAKLNEEFVRGGTGGAVNDLLDQRDKLLGTLSELVGVTVTEKTTGAVDIYLGGSTSGPRLVAGKDFKELAVRTIGDRIEVIYDPYGAGGGTNELSSGALAGALDYYRKAVNVRSDINRLAVAFADMMNRQHRQGIDLSGRGGIDLFSTESLTAKPAASNKGVTEVAVDVSQAGTLQDMSYIARYDASAGLWTVKSSNNAVSVTGRDRVVIDGIVIAFSGTPQDGDAFTVSPLENAAQGIRLLTDDPTRLAAALPRYTEVATTNQGTGDVRLETGAGDTSPPKLPRIQDVLTRSLSPASALGLARNGVVATIPSGAREVTLASLGSLSAASFDVTKTTNSGPPSITMVVGADTTSVTLPLSLASGGAAGYAEAINAAFAAATGPDGKRYSESLFASATGNVLTVNGLGGTPITTMSIAGLQAGKIEAATSASDILVFTREGRQLTGPLLGIAERDALLTQANGFTKDAVYVSPTDTAGYRGMPILTVSRPVAVMRGGDGIDRVAITAVPETDSVQTDASGLPIPGAVYALDVAGLPSVRLGGADVAGLGSVEVATKLNKALEASATMQSFTGSAVDLPTEPAEFSVLLNGRTHKVRFTPSSPNDPTPPDGQLFSVDGPADPQFGFRVDGGRFVVTLAYPPSFDRHEVVVSGSGAAALGLDGALSGTQTGARVADAAALAAGREIAVDIGGTVAIVPVAGTSGEWATVVNGEIVNLMWSTGADGRLRLSSAERSDIAVISRTLAERNAAVDLGFLGTDLSVTRTGAEIAIGSRIADPNATVVDGSRSVSRIGDAVTLDGPVPEDLIVIMRGDAGDKRALVGRFPEDMTRTRPEAPDIVEVRITGPGSVEIFDASGVSLAHRSFAEGEAIEYQGLRFSVTGRPAVGDSFSIVKDASRTGDARNALLLAGLRTAGILGGDSASFQDAYLEAAAKLATASQAASLTSTSAQRAASDLRSAFEGKTGVNLDDEAADLIRFQQAYQAAAQVVMAARDMFQTILKSF